MVPRRDLNHFLQSHTALPGLWQPAGMGPDSYTPSARPDISWHSMAGLLYKLGSALNHPSPQPVTIYCMSSSLSPAPRPRHAIRATNIFYNKNIPQPTPDCHLDLVLNPRQVVD